MKTDDLTLAALKDAAAILAQGNQRSKRLRHAQRYIEQQIAEAPFCWSNFHDASEVVFHRVSYPTRPADYVSASGSQYWNYGNGVIRLADHWGTARSCYWLLEGKASEFEGMVAGYAPFARFRRTRVHNGVRFAGEAIFDQVAPYTLIRAARHLDNAASNMLRSAAGDLLRGSWGY